MRRVPPTGTEGYHKGKDAQARMPHPPRGIEQHGIAGDTFRGGGDMVNEAGRFAAHPYRTLLVAKGRYGASGPLGPWKVWTWLDQAIDAHIFNPFSSLRT